jgi:hypothetical protein
VNKTNQFDKSGKGVIIIPGDRYFPEGVTSTSDGTFFVGSLYEGCIMQAQPVQTQMEAIHRPGANGLVSVLGLWARCGPGQSCGPVHRMLAMAAYRVMRPGGCQGF